MIWVQLSGGLGNQLFMVCYAFTLSTRRSSGSCPIHLLTHLYNHPNSRPLYFDSILRQFASWCNSTPLSRVRHLPTVTDVAPHVANAWPSVLLRGYFQKWTYVQPGITRMAQLIDMPGRARPQTIALHFRQGDYLQPPYNAIYHLLSSTYYRRAIDAILAARPDMQRILVFCEEIDWSDRIQPLIHSLARHVTCPFERPSCTRDWEQFHCMAQCGAIVTANSSFSYWAALLGDPTRSTKMVVRPTVWWTPAFKAHPSAGIVADGPDDICPPEWIGISDHD